MQQYYKPNAKKTGHAVGLSFNSKDGALYIQIVKQTGWNDKTKRGSFTDGDKFNVKFNKTEIGAVLNCIERNISERLYHASDKGDVSIEIKPFTPKPRDENDKPVPNGFVLSLNPKEEGAQQFGFWFDRKEARELKEYLQFVLHHFYAADYSAEKKKRDEYYKNKQKEGDSTPEENSADEQDPFAK